MEKEILKQLGFNDEVKLVESSKCPFCKKDINPEKDFKDDLSKKEFKLSGLCQSCQDEMF